MCEDVCGANVLVVLCNDFRNFFKNLLSRETMETLSSGVPEKSVHVNLSAIEEQLGGGGGGYDGCGGGDCGMRLGVSWMEAEG